MKKQWLCYSFFFLLLIGGCKSKQVLYQESSQHSWLDMAGLVNRISGLQQTDTLVQHWERILDGTLTVWTLPDSTGKQYKQAELVLHSQEAAQKEQRVHSLLSDTTAITVSARQEEVMQEENYEEQIRDWRPGIRIIHLIIGGVLCLFALFLYFRKKRG